MDFDDQLLRYFGTTDLGASTPAALESGRERLAVEFGLEKDRGRRFAMWSLMHVLGCAPDIDLAFVDRHDREMARDFMDMLARSEDISLT
jgi:hypothetical protein